MYVELCAPISSDASPDSAFAIQSTVIPLPATHITLGPTSAAKAEIPLKGKDNVYALPSANILDTDSNSASLFQMTMTRLPVPRTSATDRAGICPKSRASLPTLTMVAMTLPVVKLMNRSRAGVD